jgi:PAS domain S-box-containing protein
VNAKAMTRNFASVGTVAVVAALLATIYIAPERVNWVTFLAGILTAAALALVVRASRAEWIVRRRSAQLVALRGRHAREVQLRKRAEEALADAGAPAQKFAMSLPATLFYIGADRRVRFHNTAFREWLGVKSADIDNRDVGQLLDPRGQRAVSERITAALAGETVIAESTHRGPGGAMERMSTQYLPHFGDGGNVVGAYALLTDITRPVDLPAAAAESDAAEGRALYVDTIAKELTGWKNIPDQLRHSLEKDEFRLYCQAIVPAAPLAPATPFYEILIRLTEEERNLMPPGVFLQLAEEHGMLPDIDRWVVRHLLDWGAERAGARPGIYSVNISGQTLDDPDFAEFVVAEIGRRSLPGFTLCFEFSESEVLARTSACSALVLRLRTAGCRTAISAFGRNLASFDLLKSVAVDYVKIDAGIVLGVMRDAVSIVKVKAINRVAHAAGIATIAECVEDDATLDALGVLGVDLAQGFGIGRPIPLTDLG